MESVYYQQQEQIPSQTTKQYKKIKNFKEYLVSSQTLHHFVKFLFGLRTKQQHDQGIPNQDALEMFRDYFGALTPDKTQQDLLRQQINLIKNENQGIQKEIIQIKSEIQAKVISIEKAKEEKRLKEEEQAKNPKKGAKK